MSTLRHIPNFKAVHRFSQEIKMSTNSVVKTLSSVLGARIEECRIGIVGQQFNAEFLMSIDVQMSKELINDL